MAEDFDDLLDDLDDLPVEEAPVSAAEPSRDTLDVAAAASAMRAATSNPPPPPPDLIPAPVPVPLHTIRFPVYDRKAKGFRIIERALGNNEVKATLKVLLDVVLTSGRYDDPQTLDASREVIARHTPQPDIPHPFHCRDGVLHDTRLLEPLAEAGARNENSSRRERDYALRFLGSIDECLARARRTSMNYGYGFNIDEMRIGAKTAHDEWERLQIESHAPFITWSMSSTMWQAVLPYGLARNLIDHHDRRRSEWAGDRARLNLPILDIEERTSTKWLRR